MCSSDLSAPLLKVSPYPVRSVKVSEFTLIPPSNVASEATERVEEAESASTTFSVELTVEEAPATKPSGKFHANPVVDAW